MMKKYGCWLMAVAVVVGCSAPAWSADNAPAKSGATAVQAPPGALPANFQTLEQILEQAVHNIARRYNLNEEQTQYTMSLMKERVYEFLNKHHDEVWPVIRDLASTGLGLNPGALDPEQLKRMGAASKPLLEEAMNEIYKANEEWGKKLTPEQKAMHDFDLREMQRVHGVLRDTFQQWSEGNPVQQRVFPIAQKHPNEPPRPAMPGPGLPKAGYAEMTLDFFATRVEEFIKEYELDPTQIESARSIMREYREKAGAHLSAKKKELEANEKAREAATKAHDREAIAKAEAEYRELREPVDRAFQQMDDRLMALLTQAQKDRHAQKQAGGESGAAASSKTPDKPAGDTTGGEIRKRPTPKPTAKTEPKTTEKKKD